VSRLALAFVLGAGVLAMARSVSRTRRSATSGILGSGRSDLERIQNRYRDERMRAAALRWRDRFFPGVPVSAMIAGGVTATARTERGGPPDYAAGLYGYELTPNGRARAVDAQTLREFGRAIDTSAPAFGEDIEGQTYLGFRSYREHLDTAARLLPQRLRPAEGTVLLYRVAVSSYSSGPAKVAAVMRGAAGALGAALDADPLAPLWAPLGRAVIARADEGHATIGGIDIAGRWNAAYYPLRCERRFLVGRALANAEPDLEAERAWYVGHELPRDVADRLQALV